MLLRVVAFIMIIITIRLKYHFCSGAVYATLYTSKVCGHSIMVVNSNMLV